MAQHFGNGDWYYITIKNTIYTAGVSRKVDIIHAEALVATSGHQQV